MTVRTRPITADDLWGMPHHGGHRELVKGELRDMSPAGGAHGHIAVTIAVLLGHHVQAAELGMIFAAETGFVVGRNPDTVLAPDVSFVRAGRLPPGKITKKFIPLVPDLAVEVLSPWDKPGEVKAKIADWLEAGVGLLWVADPDRETIDVHRPGRPTQTLRTTDALEGEDVVPGFRCRVAEVFE
jgi:Uma2 family endonuclease